MSLGPTVRGGTGSAAGRSGLTRVLDRLGTDPLSQVARLRRGPGDPSHRRVAEQWWRAGRCGSGTYLLRLVPGARVTATAWGEGAAEALGGLPELLGAHDDGSGFTPRHPMLAEAWRRNPGLRVGRTGAVVESLVPAIIEQKVTGREAFGSQRRLLRRFGTPAPGPAQDPDSPAAGMICPPTPAQWAAIPTWEWLRAGVEERRARTVTTCVRRAEALERTLQQPDTAQVDVALRSIPGIGPWTSAEVRQRAHGDPDAWSIGDYHVPGLITLALVGEALDDDAALEVLEPYRGHRYRVQQLVMLAGPRPERRGPRRGLPSHLGPGWLGRRSSR